MNMHAPTPIALIRRSAEQFAHTQAVWFPNSVLTYAQLSDFVDEWAMKLIGVGIEPGDHVGIYMTNSTDFIGALFGIGAIGAVPVPLNTRYRSDELAYVVDQCDLTTVLVCDRSSEDFDLSVRFTEAFPAMATSTDPLSLALPNAPSLTRAIFLGHDHRPGFIGAAQFAESGRSISRQDVEERSATVSPRDVGLIIYTSGTTGRPKGAMLSNESLVRTGIALGTERYQLTPDDKMWNPLPLFHMAGLLPLVAALDAGATFFSLPKVDASAGLDCIRNQRITVAFCGFPLIITDILDLPGFDGRDLQTLRILHTNGTPAVLERIQRTVPSAIQVNPYGCTEVGGMVATSELTDSAQERIQFSGRPYSGLEVRIVDSRNVPVPIGSTGEIVARGYSLFEGYYNNLGATSEAIDELGYFHTGDLGRMDAYGRLQYITRLKDMLKVGGENVAAVEIEDQLSGHPDVRVAAVVGRPHDRLGEVPVAFVELLPDRAASAEDLIAFCQQRIASFKVPREIIFVSEWPMSSTKIQKFELRKRLLPGDLPLDAASRG